MNDFKPMLAIDATDDLHKLRYPKYASFKLDGIRAVFHPRYGLVSRALKQIPNKQLQEKFSHIIKKSVKNDTIYDGEFYAHDLTFQEITRAVMTQDFDDEKTRKKLSKELQLDDVDTYIASLLNKIEFHCFEIHNNMCFRFSYKILAEDGFSNITFEPYCKVLHQRLVHSKEEVLEYFEHALENGYEGLILRCPDSLYKHGRSTLKEESMLKVKPFETFDAVITDVVQGTEVDENAEKKINELGRSVTSRKQNDRVLIDKAAAFVVQYNNHNVKVSLAMTDEEKEEVWKNRGVYIGRMLEYKGMLVGAKDVPRHPVFVRFRDDKHTIDSRSET